ncbi:hypothetical protein MVES_000753 [Malassezia vespertilionis]|uniref:Uncharacterized protein n=1 Tax=Malassezia vespertilionis TaxID=2020962 RepID=A0A2N1JEL3_9BASI|nr:hypothetical protein MVES_000753 [Malassezia vespertilionis]
MALHAAPQPELRAVVSFAPFANSDTFINAVVRDVHILIHSFALTWAWLDGQTQPQSRSLRWEYGALVAFERVWIRNQWTNTGTVLGSDASTRRAFYNITAQAFIEAMCKADDGEHTILHSVGALFGLYLLWSTQPEPVHTPITNIDQVAYTCMLQLVETARDVLDTGVAIPGYAPPSADVLIVVDELVRCHAVRLTISSLHSQPPNRLAPSFTTAHCNVPSDVLWHGTPGFDDIQPVAPGTTLSNEESAPRLTSPTPDMAHHGKNETANVLAALAQSQQAYTEAREHLYRQAGI